MNILDVFRRQKPDETRSVAFVNPSTLSINMFPRGAAGQAIAAVPETATGVPAVYAAVSMIAKAVSVLPWEARNRMSLERTNPQPQIVRLPDPTDALAYTREQIITAMLLYGEAFCYLDQHGRDGKPTVAVPIDNSVVTIHWNENRTRRIYKVGGETVRRNRDILHIPMLRYPGWLHGLGPIQAARVSVAGSLAAEEMAEGQWTDGGPPIDGVVTVPGKLTADEATLHREQWQAGRSGQRGPAFLSGGMQFNGTRLSNTDLQFLESRNYGVLDVARLFHIPPKFLSAELGGSSLSYANNEESYVDLVRNAYQPVADNLEIAFGELIPATQIIETDFRSLLRADVRTRFETYQIASEIGILTPNEMRKAERLDPIAGGDEMIAQTGDQDSLISTEETST